MKPFLLIFSFLLALWPLQAAESYLVMEANSARVLLAQDSEKKRPVASLAKVASSRVALDWAKASQVGLSTMITVPYSVQTFGGGNPMGLLPGDRLSIRDAIYSSMLGSDNAAMHALADHVGRELLSRRQREGDPQKAFVTEMNQLAKALGMRRTKFTSAHGLDQGYWKSYSTAADIARLCVYAMRDSGFVFYVKQKSRKISVVSADGKRRSFNVKNTNQLIGKMHVNGIKAAESPTAGSCLAVNAHLTPLVNKLDDGRTQIRPRDFVVILLGSADRFEQSQLLINQGKAEFKKWGDSGYSISKSRREYIVVPRLR